VSDARFAEATNLIARYPDHPLRTLDALHLTVAAELAAFPIHPAFVLRSGHGFRHYLPKYQVVIPKRVREQFGLAPGQQLQVIALPGRIELVPSQPPAALRGFLQGDNTFQREPDRL